MAKYKQGYSDRKDESMSMRNGKESGKMQSFKSRRDESYGMGKIMGHEKQPKKCDAFAAQKSDMSKLDMMPSSNRGHPSQAYDYKY